ncbi:MAG: acyl carrier protein [Desulfobacterales bacterium]|jgi:acyl carrier protein
MDKEQIMEKIKAEVEALASCKIEDYDKLIFKSGILDSLNILNIIVFLEEEFSIKIYPFDVNLDILGSLNKICQFVYEKVEK